MKVEPAALGRPARVTRGQRLSKLVDEEVEADEEFWGQEAFKEEDADNEYEEEQDHGDEFDSDFDDDEEESEDGEGDEKERRPTKKRKLPPGGKKVVKKGSSASAKKKGVSFLEEAAAAADAGEVPRPRLRPARLSIIRPSPEEKEDGDTLDLEGEKSLRKSSRTAVIVKQAEREAQRAIQQALPKIIKKKKGEEEKKMTQEEMLLEAAQTGASFNETKFDLTSLILEIQNRQSLEIMLAREEEVKRRAIIHKEEYSGPLIRFYSKDGINILEFTKVVDVPEVIRARAVPYPKQPVCVVTGLPARYRDPKSGLPYATKGAYAIIRERLRKGENPTRKDPLEKLHQRKRTKVERETPGPGGRPGLKITFKRPVRPVSQEARPLNPSEPQTLSAEVDKRTTSHATPSSRPPSSSLTTQGSLSLPAGPTFTQPSGIKNTPVLIPAPLPRPMVEANEADFMLEDLEVSLPSNLESGLTLPTSGIPSSMVQAGELTGQGGPHDLHLEHEMLDLSPSGPRFSEGYDLTIDGHSSSILSLDVSWLQNT